MKISRSVSLAAISSLAVFCGCAISPYHDANWDQVEATLHAGMTVEQVSAALGQPTRVEGARTANQPGGIVTWVYSRRVPLGTTMVATRTIDVPWVDPITGELKMLKEPSYSPVHFYGIEEFHLHWHQDVLYQWQRFVRQEASYD